MAQDNVFGDLMQAPVAPARAPGVIYGRPDPYKASAEARAVQDQALQAEANARADRAEARAERAESKPPAGYQWAADGKTLVKIPGGPADQAASGPATVEERKASAFLTRALGASKSYEDTGVGARSLIGESMHANTPGILNTLPGFVGNSPERQVADTAQDEFIAATLRQDSGAAIPPAEMLAQRRIYFPMPGDGPEVIAQKRAARLRAIDGLIQSSGRSLTDQQKQQIATFRSDLDKALSGEPVGAAPQDKTKLGTPVIPEVADKLNEGRWLNDEQAAAYNAFNKANPTATREQLASFISGLGVSVPTNLDEIIKFRDEQGGMAPGETGRTTGPDISDARGEGGVVEGADAFMRGAADTVSLGSADRIAAIGDTLFGGGTMDENLARQRAIDRYDAENSPWLRGSGQLAGGIILPVGRGATTVLELAGVGGGLGAAYGYNSAEDWGLNAVGEGIKGGVAGAALGASLGKLGDIWRRRGGGSGGPGGPTPPTDGLDDVAARMGIRPSPATVGGRTAEGLQIGLGNAPGSMGPVRAGVEAEIEGISNAARDAASRMGPVTTPQQAGEIISRGARVADRAQARAAGDQYNARTAMMGGEGAPVTMGGAQTAIANIGSDFASNDVVGELLTHPLVRRLASADANELTLGESTELLSEARRVLNRARQTKQPGRLIGQLRELEGAIEGDVMRAAQASDAIAGRAVDQGAVAAQREGDRLWADRMLAQKQEFKKALASTNDDVNVSGESVYRQLFQDMREEGGNLVRLRRTLDRLPQRARDAFSATAFDDLGKAVPSQQNAAGDAWSFETFMKNWGGASDAAKRLVFQGRGVDREIDDIVRYAERLSELNKARNFSNTGATAANAGFVSALASALVGGTAAGGLGTGLAASGAVASTYPALNIAGRAFMATPAMRSWLRSAMQASVRGNESQARTLIRRLPTLAAKNPAISSEISQFERSLLSAVNDNRPLTAAASDDDKQKGGNR